MKASRIIASIASRMKSDMRLIPFPGRFLLIVATTATCLAGCLPLIGQSPSFEYQISDALRIFYPIFRQPASSLVGYRIAGIKPAGVDHFGLIGVTGSNACPQRYMRDCQSMGVDVRIKDFPIAFRQLKEALANPCERLTKQPSESNEGSGQTFIRTSDLTAVDLRNAINGIKMVFYCDKPANQRPKQQIFLDLFEDLDGIEEIPPANWIVYGKTVKYGAKPRVVERLLVKSE